MGGQESIWVAKFPQDRFSGLIPQQKKNGSISTKPFIWPSDAKALYVNAAIPEGSTSTCGISVSSVKDASNQFRVGIINEPQKRTEVCFNLGDVLSGRQWGNPAEVKLHFDLSGSARLYAFSIK